MAKTIVTIIWTVLFTTLAVVYVYSSAIVSQNILNMDKVQTFEATETGVLLILEDGTGYYIEK